MHETGVRREPLESVIQARPVLDTVARPGDDREHSSFILRETDPVHKLADNEWITFSGGELQGKRPNALCPACRGPPSRGRAGSGPRPPRVTPLCFQCYRADLDRERALVAAGRTRHGLGGALSGVLPLEPVNRPRLAALKAARTAARAGRVHGWRPIRGQSAPGANRRAPRAAGDWRRRAAHESRPAVHGQVMAAAIHAAELQLPESWLPFVVSR